MKTFALIAAALALTAPALANAQAWQVGDNSYHLYLTDLDLHTAAGRAEALGRVEKVAAKLCADKGVRTEQLACVAQTVQASVQGSAATAIKLAISERSRTTLALAGR